MPSIRNKLIEDIKKGIEKDMGYEIPPKPVPMPAPQKSASEQIEYARLSKNEKHLIELKKLVIKNITSDKETATEFLDYITMECNDSSLDNSLKFFYSYTWNTEMAIIVFFYNCNDDRITIYKLYKTDSDNKQFNININQYIKNNYNNVCQYKENHSNPKYSRYSLYVKSTEHKDDIYFPEIKKVEDYRKIFFKR